MKIRNAILALGLAIALSFSFSTTLSATTSDIPVIEEGVTGVIEQMIITRSEVVIHTGTTGVLKFSLVSENGETVHEHKTDASIVSISVSEYASGNYTLIASNGTITEFYPISL